MALVLLSNVETIDKILLHTCIYDKNYLLPSFFHVENIQFVLHASDDAVNTNKKTSEDENAQEQKCKHDCSENDSTSEHMAFTVTVASFVSRDKDGRNLSIQASLYSARIFLSDRRGSRNRAKKDSKGRNEAWTTRRGGSVFTVKVIQPGRVSTSTFCSRLWSSPPPSLSLSLRTLQFQGRDAWPHKTGPKISARFPGTSGVEIGHVCNDTGTG